MVRSCTRVSIGGSEGGLRTPGTGGDNTTGGLAALEGSPVVSSCTCVSACISGHAQFAVHGQG